MNVKLKNGAQETDILVALTMDALRDMGAGLAGVLALYDLYKIAEGTDREYTGDFCVGKSRTLLLNYALVNGHESAGPLHMTPSIRNIVLSAITPSGEGGLTIQDPQA